jgi:hypothetical protein
MTGVHCPSGDPAFNRVLAQLLGHQPTPNERRNLFYGVCIWVRLALCTFVYMQRAKAWVPWIVGAFSVLSLVNLLRAGNEGRQWWSKRFQTAIAAALLVTCLARILVPRTVPDTALPILLYGSLLGGIAQSLGNPFC